MDYLRKSSNFLVDAIAQKLTKPDVPIEQVQSDFYPPLKKGETS